MGFFLIQDGSEEAPFPGTERWNSSNLDEIANKTSSLCRAKPGVRVLEKQILHLADVLYDGAGGGRSGTSYSRARVEPSCSPQAAGDTRRSFKFSPLSQQRREEAGKCIYDICINQNNILN